MKSTTCLLLLLLISCSALRSSSAEQCGRQAGGALCPNNLCCSYYGFCGNAPNYCGQNCQSQCGGGGGGGGGSAGGGGGGGVSTIITSGVFGQFLSQNRGPGCPSNGFYTYNAFIAAAGSFSGFGTTGGSDIQKRELAAFFANVAHETGSGCYVEEINKMTHCDSSSAPCAPGQQYFGRGPLMLTGNYNYQEAGRAVNFDGINDPGRVSRDPTVSFGTAVWYWMTQHSPTCHAAITGGQGFGATIKAINAGQECGPNAPHPEERQSRISLYQSFCSILNVHPGANLNC